MKELHREMLHSEMLRQVVAGADGRATRALLQEFTTGKEGLANEITDILASELPGKWFLISESWQGHEQDHLFLKALYLESDLGCLVSGDLALFEDPHVDTIWLDVQELKEIVRIVS